MNDRWLLVSDVDNTLLGDDEATQRFAAFYEAHHPAFQVSFASGRFYHSLLESVRETPLPLPDYVIGGVGTDIHKADTGELITAWHAHIDENWDADAVRKALEGVEGLELQPAEFQSPFKLSYYYYDASGQDLRALEARIHEAGVEAQLIYSSKRDLDFLPFKAGKGKAAAFLAEYCGIPAERVMVSGDSGNDLTLFQEGFHGIVVANAHEELKALQHENVFHASLPYAGGVLQGLEYWMKGA